MKQVEMDEIVAKVVGKVVERLSPSKDNPYIDCPNCQGGKRWCPYLDRLYGEGTPRLCAALTSHYIRSHQLCVLEHTSICAIWERIKKEWEKQE